MQVKVQKRESIIVKVLRPVVKQVGAKKPTDPLLIIHNLTGDTNFTRVLVGENAFHQALGANRDKAYFRCLCRDNPNTHIPEIINEISEDDVMGKRCA